MPDHAPLPDTVAELHAMVLAQQASIAVNGGQNPTPDGGVDQKCETIPVLQGSPVLVVDGIDGRYRVRRKEPEGRVQTHPTRLVSGRGDAGVRMR
jgi:hypothetical protein